MVIGCVFFVGLATLGSVPGLAADPDQGTLQFNRDIRPILSEFCFACHGPDGGHREADLRLDVAEDALARSILVPGDPAASALIDRIESTDPAEVMPPPSMKKSLTPEQIRLLRRWIEEGAAYQKHWAYEPPKPPSLASDSSAIDALIEARLNELDMKHVHEADRRTLIRRLYSDLIGLPPTPQEVEAFETDRSPDAYANLVERLLASPHYGERMALGWLDVVRFADTIGYHSDNPRNVWPYRDWVIRSFQQNKPFDRFTIEQIAGDLMPDADQETRVGSAFNRMLLSTEEGGAQPKDYEARMLADRVRAIGTVWLGQTTGCAQCHDHKFDPFTMRDFYGLGAFFADIQEGLVAPREEGMAVLTAEQHTRLDQLDQQLKVAKTKLEACAPKLDEAQSAWEHSVREGTWDGSDLVSKDSGSEADKKKLGEILAIVRDDKPNERQRQQVKEFFRTRVTMLCAEERMGLDEAERARADYYRSLPKCLVSKSAAKKRTVRLLPRGNWMDESGDVMSPAFPSYLPQPRKTDREWNRLDLARWLVSDENPLTARVVMNRMWKHFFGMGISKVLEDLGAQGEPPTHPELLDYLACEFMKSGWNWKHMVRLIVMSRTYRQSSIPTPEMLVADPYNRLLARQSAFRMDAELIRDYALSVSGLLDKTIGGPSAKPYQPEGYWEHLNFPARTYTEDRGSAQYRRGLYTWWQRSFLHPSLLAFDAPTREECCAERTRSNIPQQALVLLNDPTYVEAARAFAHRILSQGGASDDERLDWAFRSVLVRSPRTEEVEPLKTLLQVHRERYQADEDASRQLLGIGYWKSEDTQPLEEMAAWTHMARVLLSLHETITRN